MSRTIALIVAVALVGAAAGAWLGGVLVPPRGAVPSGGPSIGDPSIDTYAKVGDRYLDATLPMLDGSARKLSDYAGRPIMLNFWATWCGPCIEEMPMLDAYQRELGAANLQIVGIAQDDPAAVAEFLGEVPVSYPVLLDEPGPRDLSVRYGNVRNVLPYSVLIAANGEIVAQRAGSFDRTTLEAWTARLR